MYGNIQGIKNLMSHYDKDGDYINPVNGLARLLVTDENENSRKRIISISDSSKEEMYELTKKEFLRENGVCNGDTTKRTDETAFYTNEKNEISGICNQFLNDRIDQKLFCNEMKDRLNDYYGSRYELRNQSEAVEGRVSNMLSKLQHMYAL